MNDLAKLREKFEKEYKLAELENKFETAHPEMAESGLEIRILESVTQGGNLHSYFSKQSSMNITEKDAAMLLSIFPADSKFPVYQGSKQKYQDEYYDMSLERNPKDTHTILEIRWMHEDVEMSVKFPITEESILHDYFKETTRQLSESEISSYGIQKNRFTYNMRNFFKVLDWANGQSIHYVGGRYQQTYHSVKNQIVEDLKYSYQFSED